MSKIRKPMQIPDLNLWPPIEDTVRLSEDMQQTLAQLAGYDVNTRKLLRCSASGILSIASPRLIDIIHYERTALVNPTEGDNLPCTEVLVLGHPENAGTIWVRSSGTAGTTNSWPLAAGAVVGFSVDNMSQLKMHLPVVGEIAIVGYTR